MSRTPENETVALASCHPGMVCEPWHRSILGITIRDAYTARRIVGNHSHHASGAHVATARCDAVRAFLDAPQQADWLFFTDTDATFDDDLLEQLLASADPEHRPIVGALAFGVNEHGHLFPTLYFFDDNGQTLRLDDYTQGELLQVHATGAHALLVHRSVLADPRWMTDAHPLPWFRSGSVLHGREVSEDVFFCVRAGALGFPIHVDTAARTGHLKTFNANETRYLEQRAAAG